MSDFTYYGHKATAKTLADIYVRDALGAFVIFSACDQIDPKIKQDENGVYICNPFEEWTARVLMTARDNEGKCLLVIDMTILEVGEYQTNFRIDNLRINPTE